MSFLSPTMQYTLTLLPLCGRVFITVCKVVLTLKDTRLAIRKTFSRVNFYGELKKQNVEISILLY